tara:strand:- start:13357 stop:14079 length:723 start_codon:yes stop_codon:yes gene_type:complete
MFIIPMAGKSSRFYKEGYNVPKFMLPLGKTLVFTQAIKSFSLYFKSDFFLFIIRNENGVADFVNNQCKHLGISNYEVVSLNSDTRGQAETVYFGIQQSKLINHNDDIYIFNIDSIRLNFSKPTKSFLKDIGGYLEVFKGEGNHWSFIEKDDNGFVKRTTEKIRISNLCSNGLYYFKSCNLFMKTFKKLELVNNYKELFVAPMYNLLIQKKMIVKFNLINTSSTLFSGTPKEYELLIKKYS